MSESPSDHRHFSWTECCGFTRLFRALNLALNPTTLSLVFCLVLCTYLTGRILDSIWPSAHQAVQVATFGGMAESELDRYVAYDGGCAAACQWRDEMLKTPDSVQRVEPFKLLMAHWRAVTNQATEAALAGSPDGFRSALRAGVMSKAWLISLHPVYGIIFFVVCLVVWAYFGGAACRVIALQATRDERLGFRSALAFSRKKLLSYVGAPLMPYIILVFIGLALLVGGLLGAIPVFGELFVGLFFWLAVIIGFLMAFIIIGAVVGGSLMYPTIAVEGSDAFDALSRAFSFFFGRPWRTLFYAAVSIVYGALCLVIVKYIARLALVVVHMIVGWGMNLGSPYVADGADATLKEAGKLDAMWKAPSLTGETPFWGAVGGDLAHVSWLGQLGVYVGVFAVFGLVVAFVVSFYFSASTQIYLLLRREVDATDLEEVYVDEPSQEAVPPPSAPDAGESKPPESGPAPA